MKTERLRLIHNNQRGITLVELMIAIALFGLVAGALTMTFAHVFTASTRTSAHMTAVRQVQSAGYWVSRDALQAQHVVPDETETSGFPLTLSWEWDDVEYKVIYTVTADNELRRTRSVDEVVTDTGIVAQFLDSVQIEPMPYYRGKLTFTVVATVGGQTEQRVYELIPRPGS